MSSIFFPISGAPKIHSTPLARVTIRDSTVILEVDDLNEHRTRLCFKPYQAIQITTADCFESPGGATVIANTLVEVRPSAWIERLTEQQKRIDETATFMKRARHFLVPLQDDFLEVVAWEVTWES